MSRSLTRGPDGKFDDTKLAAIIKDACVVLLDNWGDQLTITAELSIQPRVLGLVELPIS